jgi:hypothetical protein
MNFVIGCGALPFSRSAVMIRLLALASWFFGCLSGALALFSLLVVPEQAFADSSCVSACQGACNGDQTCIAGFRAGHNLHDASFQSLTYGEWRMNASISSRCLD